MWRGVEDSKHENRSLLTLIHGLDRKGRPVIKGFVGNSQHPVYYEYQDVIDKHYHKATKLAAHTRSVETPFGEGSSASVLHSNSVSRDCLSERGGSSGGRSSQQRTPSICGSRSPICVDLKGMRAMISRLQCSLAIHAGFCATGKEPRFLPAIPVRLQTTKATDRSDMGCPKNKLPSSELSQKRAKRNCSSVPTSLTSGLTCCKQNCSKLKKGKRQNKLK